MHDYNNGLAWPAACSAVSCRTFWLSYEFAGSVIQKRIKFRDQGLAKLFPLAAPQKEQFPTVFLVCFHVTHPGVLYALCRCW